MHDTLRATVAARLLTQPPVASLPPALHETAGSTGAGALGARHAPQAPGAHLSDVWNMGHPVWTTPGGGMSGLPAALVRQAGLARAGAAAGQTWRVV